MNERNLPLRHMYCIDGLSQEPKLLCQATHLERTVREVAKMADMAILNLSTSDIGMETRQLGLDPHPHESGFSTLALISTSHIALHAWPHLSYFMFDIASCKPFDSNAMREHLHDALALDEVVYEASSHAAELLSFRKAAEKQIGQAI